MSFKNAGLSGLDFETTLVSRPIGKLLLTGKVGADLIIPESVSDTARIISTCCDVTVTEILSENSSVTVRGRAEFKSILLGEDGSVGCVNSTEEFEIKDYAEGAEKDSILIFGGSEAQCAARLVNPRKINYSAEISALIYALAECNVRPSIIGTESLDDEMSLKKRKSSITSIDTATVCENDIPVSCDIVLEGNFPPMSEIIYCSLKLRPSDLNCSPSSIDLKTDATLDCIYRSEEGNVFGFNKSVVIEKAFPADGADGYEWLPHLSAKDVSAEIAIDNYGEARVIELDFLYDAVINGVRNVTVETVTDAYSTDYECENITAYGESITFKRKYSSSLSVNASADREEISAEEVRSILLGSVRITDVTCKYSEDKKKLTVEGNAKILAACESNVLSDNKPDYLGISFDYPFKIELDVGEHSNGTIFETSVCVTDARFRCDQNRIYCDFENSVQVLAFDVLPCSYLCEIALNKSVSVPQSFSPITLCYPIEGETLWDIAKYYKVSSETIALSNGLNGDDIGEKKVLLIPSVKRRGQLFTKVN